MFQQQLKRVIDDVEKLLVYADRYEEMNHILLQDIMDYLSLYPCISECTSKEFLWVWDV